MALPLSIQDLVPASRLIVEPRRGRLGTGLGVLDRQLGGGWPAAALSELVGRRSAGRTSVLHSSLAAAMGRGQAVALVDAAGALDPRAAEAAGLDLRRLLWVHATGQTQVALQAADLLVAAGGFGMVAIDLGERPGRVPDAAWVRLRRVAERQGTAILLTAPFRVAGASAAAAVLLRATGIRMGQRPHPPLFTALETQASIERLSQRFHEGFSTEGFSTEGFSTEGFSTEGFSTKDVSTEGVFTEGVSASISRHFVDGAPPPANQQRLWFAAPSQHAR